MKPTWFQERACLIIYNHINGTPKTEIEIKSRDMFIGSLSKDQASQYIKEHYDLYKKLDRKIVAEGRARSDRSTRRRKFNYNYSGYTDDCYDNCCYSAWYG